MGCGLFWRRSVASVLVWSAFGRSCGGRQTIAKLEHARAAEALALRGIALAGR